MEAHAFALWGSAQGLGHSRRSSICVELSGTVLYIPKGLLIWLLVIFVSGAHRQP